MEKFTLAALVASLAFPAPAMAQELPREAVEEMEAGLGELLSDPTLPDRMAAMTVALVGALEAMPLGEIEAAMDGRVATDEERAHTLGDTIAIDREALAEQTRGAMIDNQETMQRSARSLALMLPVIAKAAASMAAVVDEQIPGDR